MQAAKVTRGAWSLRALMLASAVLAPAGANAAEEPGQLAEVIVTARKTAENVQAVPITVNVLGAEQLEARGVVNVANISTLVPNVMWDDSGGGTLANRITVRGIPSNASKNGFDPGVGIYMDEVYIGDEIGFNRALLDIERIEVLKGPQGTLFGRNTTAGAISIVTRRPSLNDRYADADVTFGNYELFMGRVVANMPLSEHAALKVSAIRRKREGFGFNTVTQKRDANDENHYGGRVQLLFAPRDDFDLLASAEWFRDSGSNEIQSCFGRGAGANPCGGIHPTRDSVTDLVVQDNDSRSRRTMWAASLVGHHRMALGELTSITAYRNLKAFNDQDQDYTALDFIRSGFSVPKDWQFSQELRIATPADQPLRGVAGVYYFHETRRAITPLIYKAPVVVSFGGPNQDGVSLTQGDIETDSYAVFGQGTYEFGERFVAEAGVRYTRDEKTFTYVETLSPSLLAIPEAARNARGIPLVVPLSTDSDSWGKVTGTVSLSWRPVDDVMAYVRFSRGYKSGGYNNTQSNPGFNPTKPFGPETLDQWEVGIKSELFDRRLRLNVALFRMDYTDIQLQITNPITFEKYVDNAGDVRSEGVELEFSTASFGGFSLFGNLGLQHSKYVEIEPGGTASLLGKSISYAPKASASLGVDYQREIGAGLQVRGSANASYRSDMWLDNNNTTKSREVTLVNLRAGVERVDGRWGVFVWGANIGDSRRITAATGAKAGLMQGAARVSAPRTYGVEIRGSF